MTSLEAVFAVLIPLVEEGGEECVLLTERSAHLPSYAGQVSLPGGRREPGETLVDAALRETFEEVGIASELVEVVAELECFETTIGDRVRPFVGRVLGAPEIELNPSEVERVIFVPTRVLRADPFRIRSPSEPWFTFDFDGAEIWGLTARILRRFFVEPREK